MDASGRTLLVLRHAKAVHDPSFADHERPLTGRGKRDATAAGEWLRQEGLLPGLVLCSTSLRTRQTWQQVRAGLRVPGDEMVSYDRRLYASGSVSALLEIIGETPAEVGLLMLIGHNPVLHQLVTDLTARAGLPFPTAALAVVGLPGQWLDAVPGVGTLARFWSPRAPG